MKLLYTIPWQLLGLYSTASLESLDELDGRDFAAFDDVSAQFGQSFGATVLDRTITGFSDNFSEADVALASPRFGAQSEALERYQYFYDLQVFPYIYAVLVGLDTFRSADRSTQLGIQNIARLAEIDIWSAVEREDGIHIQSLSDRDVRVQPPPLSMRLELSEVAGSANERIESLLSPMNYSPDRGFVIDRRCEVIDLLFGTDRLARDNNHYSSGPDRGRLRTGLVRIVGPVVVFPGRTTGGTACEDFEERLGYIGDVHKRYCLNWDEFDQDMYLQSIKQYERSIYVFVHGFLTSVKEAAENARRFHQLVGSSYTPVLFSWPTMENLFRYPGDRDVARVSSEELEHLIRITADADGRRKIHLIAHSMGALVLVEALKELSHATKNKPLPLGEIILMAADISRDELLFRTLPDFRPAVTRVSLYSTQNDCALLWSQRPFTFQPRVGRIPPEILDKDVDTVDVTTANNDVRGRGHSYHLTSPEVARDLREVLNGTEASARSNLTDVPRSTERIMVYNRPGGPYREAVDLKARCRQ